MNKPTQPNMTKTCSNCGQQKHLSAFLEMSGTQGSAYGNICSTCRKTTLEDAERRKKTEAEGSTTSETGHKIDSKSKIHVAIDQREHHQRIEDEYHEERKVDEELNEEKHDLKQKTDTGQKKHREEFLKQRPFLSDKKAVAIAATNNATPKQNAETITRAHRENENAALKTQGIHEERLKTEHDFTVTNLGQQITGQVRFSGQTFQQFRQWLGNAAPIANNLNQSTKEPAPKQTGPTTEPTVKAKVSESQPKDPAVEFIEKNWRPGSKR